MTRLKGDKNKEKRETPDCPNCFTMIAGCGGGICVGFVFVLEFCFEFLFAMLMLLLQTVFDLFMFRKFFSWHFPLSFPSILPDLPSLNLDVGFFRILWDIVGIFESIGFAFTNSFDGSRIGVFCRFALAPIVACIVGPLFILLVSNRSYLFIFLQAPAKLPPIKGQLRGFLNYVIKFSAINVNTLLESAGDQSRELQYDPQEAGFCMWDYVRYQADPSFNSWLLFFLKLMFCKALFDTVMVTRSSRYMGPLMIRAASIPFVGLVLAAFITMLVSLNTIIASLRYALLGQCWVCSCETDRSLIPDDILVSEEGEGMRVIPNYLKGFGYDFLWAVGVPCFVPDRWYARFPIGKNAQHEVSEANGARMATILAALPLGLEAVSVWVQRMHDTPWITQYEGINWVQPPELKKSSDEEDTTSRAKLFDRCFGRKSAEEVNLECRGFKEVDKGRNDSGRNSTMRAVVLKLLTRLFAAAAPGVATFVIVIIATIIEACVVAGIKVYEKAKKSKKSKNVDSEIGEEIKEMAKEMAEESEQPRNEMDADAVHVIAVGKPEASGDV
jgi:hypothetical protein